MADPLLIFISGGGPVIEPPPPQLEILIGVADAVSIDFDAFLVAGVTMFTFDLAGDLREGSPGAL